MKKLILFLIVTFVIEHSFLFAQPLTYTIGPSLNVCGGVVETITPNRELNSTELANTDYVFFNAGGQYFYLGITSSHIGRQDILLCRRSYGS